jgi:hypothetical protein
MKSVMICTHRKILSGRSNQINGCGMWHVQSRGEMHTGFWWGNLSDHFEDRLRLEDNIKKDFKEIY